MPLQQTTLPEVDVLRIKVAHLEFQLAQLQAQMTLTQLNTSRETLIRTTLLGYVGEDEVEGFVVDLESGTVRPRDTPREEA